MKSIALILLLILAAGCGRSPEQRLADTQAAIEAARQVEADAAERHAQLSSKYAEAEASGDHRAARSYAFDKTLAGIQEIKAEEAAAKLEADRAELVKRIE